MQQQVVLLLVATGLHHASRVASGGTLLWTFSPYGVGLAGADGST
jgi:hypothetical protein